MISVAKLKNQHPNSFIFEGFISLNDNNFNFLFYLTFTKII